MNENYSTILRQMLQKSRQQESLGGRALSPGERAAMIQGVLMPMSGAYGTGMMRAKEKDVEAKRYREEQKLQKDALRQQEEAAEIAGITQLAQIGLLGASAFGPAAASGATASVATGGATAAGAVPTIAPHFGSELAMSSPAVAGPAAGGGATTAAAAPTFGATASEVAGPAVLGGVVGAEIGQRYLNPALGKTGGRSMGGLAGGAAVGTMIEPGMGTLIGAGIGLGYGFLSDYGTLRRLSSSGEEIGSQFKKAYKKTKKAVKKLKFW
jgi:hypothetical protein